MKGGKDVDDKQIIGLYINRSESAMTETASKYGSLCLHIAKNILSIHEDAEECVNDTYHTAWNRIPPTIPKSLRAFLGRITRNMAISRFRANRAQKRYSGMDTLLSELDDCIPNSNNVEKQIEANELGGILSNWLEALPEEDCALFVRRYWHGETVKDLATRCNVSPSKIAQHMFKLRQSLKDALEEKGVAL
jgi:RNA polymerase sigma-70 factor (ECF subfamily)